MYDNNSLNESYNKFIEKLNNYLEEKKIEYKKITKKIEEIKALQDISNSFEVESIINNIDKIVKIIPTMKEELEILTFLYENNALNTEQAKTIIDKISKQKIFRENNDIEELFNELNNIEEEIEVLNNILLNKEYDNDKLIKLFNVLKISEKDQLNVITNLLINKYYKKEEKEIIYEEKIKYNKEEILDRFEKIKNEIKIIVDKYYLLIKGKDEKYLSYAKGMCSIIRESRLNNESTDLENTFNYPEENLTLFIIGLIGYKTELSNILDNITNDKIDENKYEEIELLLEIMEEELLKKEVIINDYEINKSEELSMTSNVYLLIEEFGNVLFKESDFQKDDYKKIVSLIEKLDKGIHDYEKGIQHTKIQTDYKDYPVFINKSSDLCCSYIRINSEVALIINFDRLNTIYDSTVQILYRNRELIKNTIENILSKDKEELIKQSKVKEYYLKKGVSKSYE